MKYFHYFLMSMLILISSCKEDEKEMDIDYLNLSQLSIDEAKRNVLGQWFVVTVDQKGFYAYVPANISERSIERMSDQYNVERWSKDSDGLLAIVNNADNDATIVTDTISFQYIRRNYLFYSFKSAPNTMFFLSKYKSMDEYHKIFGL